MTDQYDEEDNEEEEPEEGTLKWRGADAYREDELERRAAEIFQRGGDPDAASEESGSESESEQPTNYETMTDAEFAKVLAGDTPQYGVRPVFDPAEIESGKVLWDGKRLSKPVSEMTDAEFEAVLQRIGEQ